MRSVCVCVCVCLVDAVLIMSPSDTTALNGRQVLLRCTTDRSGSSPPIYWIRNPRVGAVVVEKCAVKPGFISQYSVNSNETGRCDLVIKAATPGLAEQYRCTDVSSYAAAQLTVIGEGGFC